MSVEPALLAVLQRRMNADGERQLRSARGDSVD